MTLPILGRYKAWQGRGTASTHFYLAIFTYALLSYINSVVSIFTWKRIHSYSQNFKQRYDFFPLQLRPWNCWLGLTVLNTATGRFKRVAVSQWAAWSWCTSAVLSGRTGPLCTTYFNHPFPKLPEGWEEVQAWPSNRALSTFFFFFFPP